MKDFRKGSVTVFLSLVMVFFLSFCLVLTEGVRVYFIKVEAAQAMELSEFSILSEYQLELFQDYGLFFLDLDYEQGTECPEILEKRVETYIEKNTSKLQTKQLQADHFWRASDGEGAAFVRQVVELMKVKSGYKLFEGLAEHMSEPMDIGTLLEENEDQAEALLDTLQDDTEMPAFSIDLPKISFPSIVMLKKAVFGETEDLSAKQVVPEECLSNRKLEKGIGKKQQISVAEKQLFIDYLFSYFSFYGCQEKEIPREKLEYQLEYILNGDAEDLKNLENIMWRIFLLRASGNYLFYHQDTEKTAKAESQAVAVAGVSGNPVLIKTVREILLIAWALDAAVEETRDIFCGGKVALYEQGRFAGIELGYEEYLYLLINTTDFGNMIYRCMDVVEMEVREKSGYQNFKLDHCTDAFEIAWMYQYDSLFVQIPLVNAGTYEENINRKFQYER